MTNTFCWLAYGKIRVQAQGCDLFWANEARNFLRWAKSLCSGSDFCELSKKLVLRLGFLWTKQKACAQARIFVNWARSLCSSSDFLWLIKRLLLRLRGEIQACPSVLHAYPLSRTTPPYPLLMECIHWWVILSLVTNVILQPVSICLVLWEKYIRDHSFTQLNFFSTVSEVEFLVISWVD